MAFSHIVFSSLSYVSKKRLNCQIIEMLYDYKSPFHMFKVTENLFLVAIFQKFIGNDNKENSSRVLGVFITISSQ